MNTSLSLHDFQQAVISFPDSPRLVHHNNTITSSLPKQDSPAIEENKNILHHLKSALVTAYGQTITDFALPPVVTEQQQQAGSPLETAFLKKVLRKATNLKEALERHQTTFPLPETPTSEECQAYLNALATYSKQEAEDVTQEVTSKETATAVTITLTDDLMTSLFLATPATSLEQLGNYITSHPTAIPTAVAAALGTEPHPISIGAFGLTSLIMHASSHGATAVALTKELERSTS